MKTTTLEEIQAAPSTPQLSVLLLGYSQPDVELMLQQLSTLRPRDVVQPNEGTE